MNEGTTRKEKSMKFTIIEGLNINIKDLAI